MSAPTAAARLLLDALERVRDDLHDALDGLTVEQLHARLDPDANPIAWLAWHLARVQDDHVAEVAGREQVWTAGGERDTTWEQRFGLPFATSAVGYGMSSDEVAALRLDDPALLTGYYDAVHERSVAFVSGITDDHLDRVVDERWDPPVTLGVRLVSVVNDCTQHVGQAAYVRGVVLRAG